MQGKYVPLVPPQLSLCCIIVRKNKLLSRPLLQIVGKGIAELTYNSSRSSVVEVTTEKTIRFATILIVSSMPL